MLLLSAVLLIAILAILFSGPILTAVGSWPMVDDPPSTADAVVVLYTGVEYYPRLVEAASLYGAGHAGKVVINGNRKSDVLREIERNGFAPTCYWAEDYIRILELYGVPRTDVIAVSAEDAFDTISEAEAVGSRLRDDDIHNIILTTSKFHARRARHIWRARFKNRLHVSAVAAKSDPYSPSCWWKEGRQIRWVMAEYGAWGYYWWRTLWGSSPVTAEANVVKPSMDD